MTDRILIRGLRLFGYHGVNPEEKIQGQRFEIDADLYVNLAKACHSRQLRQGDQNAAPGVHRAHQ